MGRLRDKVALITGGASGLGKATGQLMAKEGATVILTDLQEVEGTAVSKQIIDNGGKCSFMKQDTTSEEGWREICDYILERHNYLDILLNGAGVGGSGIEIEDMDFSIWRNCLSVNLDGVFLGCKYGIKAMRKGRGGSIINISSILGFAGLATATNYCASKGGVRLLTKAAALECARKTPLVRVNSIHPGFIDTPMTEILNNEQKSNLEDRIPSKRLGKPEDVGAAVVYLASDEASYVNGATIHVNLSLIHI